MSCLTPGVLRKLAVTAVMTGLMQVSCARATVRTGVAATPTPPIQAVTSQLPTPAPVSSTTAAHALPLRFARNATRTVLQGFDISGYLAVDRLGNIYATSTTHTLVKISPAGKLLAYWDGLESTGYRPDSAAGIAIDARGMVYVADYDASRIIEFSPDLRVIKQWGSYEYGSTTLIQPVGVAVDSQYNVFLSDINTGQIVKVSPSGQILATWGTPGEFKDPLGIALDRKGNIYVADTGNKRIIKLNVRGTAVGNWRQTGKGPFKAPADIAVDAKGRVYVTDLGSKRIVRLSSTGRPEAFWSAGSKGQYTSAGVSVGPAQHIYASECPISTKVRAYCRIRDITPAGEILRSWLSSRVPPVVAATPKLVTGKVDVGGYSLAYYCEGDGSPTVVLDAGYGNDSSAWSIVQARLAPYTRVCTFDRPGLGHSDPWPSGVSSTSGTVVKDLHTVLAQAHIPGPYVLGGHSWGGMEVRLYAYTYPGEVAGLVTVDAPTEQLCYVTSICRPSPSSHLPEKLDMQASADQLRAADHGVVKGSLGSLPLFVITRGLLPNPCNAACHGDQTWWVNEEKDLTSASSNNDWVLALWSGHEIHRQQPAVVITAIRQVVDTVRAQSHSLPPCSNAVFQPLGAECLQPASGSGGTAGR